MRAKNMIATASLCALAGVAGAATTVLADQSSSVTPQPASTQSSIRPRADHAETGDQFAIQRRAERDGDVVASGQTGPDGANMDLSRAVTTAAGVVRVVPGNGAVCLRAEDEAGSAWSCVPNADAVAGKLILTLKRPGSERVRTFGLLADGTTAATVTTASGTLQLDPTEGVYGAALDAPSTVTITSNGQDKQSARVP